jgi:alkylation response protein AidB-like acyl-CoA dehydrogenase
VIYGDAESHTAKVRRDDDQNIQFHGGMGFTWEASPHLYFKRARSSEVFLGDADAHREALAQRIGI